MSSTCTRPRNGLLEALAGPAPDRIGASDVAVVLAHPDDETIACGGQLGRLSGVSIVIVTDGAPRDLLDARRLGFATAADYAAARRGELERALRIAGVERARITALGVPDQQAAVQLPRIALALARLFAGRDIRAVVTHTYEGGHPDHDATAFAVHAAARLLRRDGRDVSLIEVPLYRLGAHGMVHQAFGGTPGDGAVVLPLTTGQIQMKRRMVAAHRTQQAVLAPFRLDTERFRPAPEYDFARPPNGGRLLYEHYPWGLDGRRWSELAHAACTALRLGDAPC